MTDSGGWIFGIDGGATASRIRAESLDGMLLREAASGGLNPTANTERRVAEVLRELLASILADGPDPRACRAGYIGAAGVNRAGDKAAMADRLARAFREASGPVDAGDAAASGPSPVFAAGNDAEPALAGALGESEGFLLVAGTGSIAYGRARSGRCEWAGGWGHLLGDEGSGFWIALEGIRRGIRSGEGRERPSRLLEAALSHFRLSGVQDLLPFAYERFDKARIASFAPGVLELATRGDPVAREIASRAADELVLLVASVYERLAPEVARKRLAFHGGLLQGNEELRKAVERRLFIAIPELTIMESAFPAVHGACRLARELL